MTQLDEILDISEFSAMVVDGYIRTAVHPKFSYTIANYTEKAQWGKVWNNSTKTCRGLIYNHETMEVLARPFPKFHNYSEHKSPDLPDLPSGQVIVSEKLDGSLGILYPTPDGPAIATRGSFVSDQALHATEIYRTRYGLIPTTVATYLFEIIYPQNRIVVDYGEIDDLVLLGGIWVSNGMLINTDLGFYKLPSCVKTFPFTSLSDVLAQADRPNHEGFVVYYPVENMWVKVKHEEYVRLHRLITGVTEKTIWELLSNGGTTQELLDHVPDEFFEWVISVTTRLEEAYSEILDRLKVEFEALGYLKEDRKKFALAVLDLNWKYNNLLFAMLDDKPLEAQIWKLIKPVAGSSFMEEI